MADPWLHVLHEDEDLIVVDKPAGLVVHPKQGGEASTASSAGRGCARRAPGRAAREPARS
ncbi:MAG: hypothetical protein R2752_19130 [Vicinamibacterales bacterium]